MIPALLQRILAAGPGPALFGLGITILAFLIAARHLGHLDTIRRNPIAAITILAAFYTVAMVGATKPPVDPPDPEEPEKIFEARVWIDADGKIILIDTPLTEITP